MRWERPAYPLCTVSSAALSSSAPTVCEFLPFTTLYQLAALQKGDDWTKVRTVLLLPDLVAYWLTGLLGTEVTNASTTGLLGVESGTWCEDIFSALNLPSSLFPPLRGPGSVLGPITAAVAAETGLSRSVEVVTVASHDTASAVVAVPSVSPNFVYVSSGTWSLVGTEVDHSILTSEAMRENFTNERGAEGRIRFLRNVGGLWLLQECLRTWEADGITVHLPALLAAAAELPSGPVIDVDDPALNEPGGMPTRIADMVAAREDPLPRSPTAIVRCLMDSLAIAYASTIHSTLDLADRKADLVHIIGGGSQNRLLCQLTADAAQRPVSAGPAEATAIGNFLIQARSRDAVPGIWTSFAVSSPKTSLPCTTVQVPSERGARPSEFHP